ncbi:DUF3592 domain-containing protein [Kordiimonas sp. SCSIO 12603]|uniref:DUF3592 domain-containing protein n=1 Tax=Kordiimonas sp. SCSIO 12603 TaxID=2829596 RepID=UPI002107A816|nr:DUF3592 domain-containing protein [Kordiimonas sp. SCSIO 12603]UTW58777.1 DUF3592 domain-containing protein [Kordiimonas sp. SCSIO 12603]
MVEVLHSFFENLLDGDKQALFIASSAYIILMGVMSLIYQWRVKSWPMAIGTLETAEVSGWGVPRADDDQKFAAKVEYTYTVDGKNYSGKRLSPWAVLVTYNLKFIIKWQMNRITKISPDKVAVFYNPKSPEKSFLIKPNTASIIITILMSGLLPIIIFKGLGL